MSLRLHLNPLSETARIHLGGKNVRNIKLYYRVVKTTRLDKKKLNKLESRLVSEEL